MSQSNQPLILLIDGNNLAHFLYTNLLPGQKMTPADGKRLIDHLGSYARTYSASLKVELCFDRFSGEPGELPDNLLVIPAEYPQTGDDLLLDRFWFHHLTHTACLVITNDEAIVEEVAEAGGTSLRAYDFVRRAGLIAPVFRAPDELPAAAAVVVALKNDKGEAAYSHSLHASIYFRLASERQQPGGQKSPAQRRKRLTASQSRNGSLEADNISIASASAAVFVPAETTPLKTESVSDTGRAADPSQPAAGRPQPAADLPEQPANAEGPYYFLALNSWPLDEGIRFLLNAFCPHHRAQYSDLIQTIDLSAPRPADLRALAELLLHACGAEPQFARRGALMSRVRLALLQARGGPLSLDELAQQTGLKMAGLRGRIKDKAGRWVEILYQERDY